MIFLDARNKDPIYKQLKDKIIEQIGTGILNADEQLAPVRVLARDLGVNPNTVQRAYTELEAQGAIYQIVGKGSFVNGDYRATEQIIKVKLDEFRADFVKAKQIGVKRFHIDNILNLIYGEGECK